MSVMRVCAASAVLSFVTASTAVAADELESVVVTAARVEQPISEVIGSVTVITREEIEQRQVQSVQDLLRGEAGIDISNTGGLGKFSSIHLRGGNASQTLILVDGVRMGSATAGTTSIEFIPVEQIERIEIVRGPRSSLYGSDAIGGVIQIFTRRNDGVSASASYGTYNTEEYSAGFGMQAKGLRFSVNGAYQQSEGFDSLGSYQNFDLGCFCSVTVTEHDDDGYRNGSASAKLGYAFGDKADLEFSTLYAQGFSEFDGGFQNQVRFRNTAPSARLRITAIDALTITLSGGITQDKNDNFKNGVFTNRYNTEKRNAAAQADWQLSKSHTLSLGADYLDDQVDSVIDPTDSSLTYAVDQRDNIGVFTQYLGTLGAHEINGSWRHDDNEQFGTHNTGNVGWKWFVWDRALAINAGWGSAFHAPSFNDLYFPFGSGNPELKPESSQSYELGLSGQASAINWSVQAYSTRVKDLIVLDSSFYPRNISEARLQGTELSVRHTWQDLSTSLNYTYQDPRSRAAGSNYDHLLSHRSRQSGSLNVRYQLGVAQLGVRINAIGSRYDDLANTRRLAGYTTVDFLSDVQLGKAFSVQIKLGNFFDRQYETVSNYHQAGRTVSATLRYQPK